MEYHRISLLEQNDTLSQIDKSKRFHFTLSNVLSAFMECGRRDS